ncbi:hypothetical protein CYMTET_49241 [Cymbomonas tetramitiformis]|uniref:UDP-glucose 6-dehydrogenase n=1 Tax=Cymbomonas tetramitiformis TaxID=36881 RepID=A0AAE0BQH7_9CHLO|nr:hypothetical protein CYMTET_49241 [Cymbomonas tetramitiformis]
MSDVGDANMSPKGSFGVRSGARPFLQPHQTLEDFRAEAQDQTNAAPAKTLPLKDAISIIGMGRLGLCTALCLEEVGFDILGVDIFPDYVDAINKKLLQSSEPLVMDKLHKSTRVRATLSIDDVLAHSDVVMIFVDTPYTGSDRYYDVSKLGRVLNQINSRRIEDKHIVICCTVFPGYCADIGRYLLRDCKNVSLSYNPEFIAQGDIIRGLQNPDVVLIGEGSPEAGEVLKSQYRRMCHNAPSIRRMTPESAELVKLSINCFVTMKIAFANQISDIADRTPQADKAAVLAAVGSDSRIGSKYLQPGYGFGGPCFPRDNRALGSYAEATGVEPLMMRATDLSNKRHAELQVQALLSQELEVYHFEGLAFKKNCPVAIIEESQKLNVASQVARAGKTVVLRDTKEVLDAIRAEYGRIFNYEEIDLN